MMAVEASATPRTSWYKEHSYGIWNLSRNRTKTARMETNPSGPLFYSLRLRSTIPNGRKREELKPSVPQCSSQGRRAPAGRQQPSCTSQ